MPIGRNAVHKKEVVDSVLFHSEFPLEYTGLLCRRHNCTPSLRFLRFIRMWRDGYNEDAGGFMLFTWRAYIADTRLSARY